MKLTVVTLLVVSFLWAPPAAAERPERRLAVGWHDAGAGVGKVRAMRTSDPFNFQTDEIVVGARPHLRAFRQRLYALSRLDRSVSIVRTRSWSLVRTLRVAADGEPVDVVVPRRGRAYVTAAGNDSLLHLDLRSGATAPVVDFSPLATRGARAEPSGMIVDGARLFVQIRQVDAKNGTPIDKGAVLAVVDLETETLIDVDPVADGIQAIALAGKFGKMKMQILPKARRLIVSATGVFFDTGGIEAIDLDTLTSLGLMVREEDGSVGADLGAFVMLGPLRGYLVFSTDLLLSSHLHRFAAFRSVEQRELRTLLDYFMPALVHVRRSHALFVPDDGTGGIAGVLVYDAPTGELLMREPIATPAAPTDLELVRGPRA